MKYLILPIQTVAFTAATVAFVLRGEGWWAMAFFVLTCLTIHWAGNGKGDET